LATEIQVTTPPGEHADLSVPYPPSVVDRFIEWVDRLPGPAGLFYLALLGVLIVLFNGIAWLAGAAPAGTVGELGDSLTSSVLLTGCCAGFVFAACFAISRAEP